MFILKFKYGYICPHNWTPFSWYLNFVCVALFNLKLDSTMFNYMPTYVHYKDISVLSLTDTIYMHKIRDTKKMISYKIRAIIDIIHSLCL